MKKKKVLKLLLVLYALFAGVVYVNAENYVKWKRVADDLAPLSSSVVVIVDLNTGLAMSNDKADKDPDAVAVTLNYDKDRILGEVPENVQWTFTITSNGTFQFAATDGNLYAESKGLKVGSNSTDNVFSKTTIDGIMYLKITIGDTDYLAGVEESMFSNTWKLKEVKDGKPNDKVKNTRFAIFMKVEDEQTIPSVSFPSENYEINVNATISNSPSHLYNGYEKATCKEGYAVGHYSSNEDVAYPVGDYWTPSDPNGNLLVLLKRGTIKLIARVKETTDHDKAVAVCTVRINDNQIDKGTITNPLTPSEAISLAKGEIVENATFDEDRCYFIKGKVNKVNSGMMAMFGDLGLDEMLGDDMDMEEMMGDMDDFDMSEMGDMMGGMDFMSMIPGFANSEGLTYYISDDGTKDNRLMVTDGRGLVTLTSTDANYFEKAKFEKLEDLSPGDDVLVYGPLVLTESNNLFASLFSGTEGIGGMGQQSEYEWAPTNLFELNSDDIVLLVDKNKKIALNSDVKGTSVKIKDDKIADNSSVSENIQWTLTKNNDGTVTFKKDVAPLSITTQLALAVGNGNSNFTYNNGVLGIEYPNNLIYCITWKEADSGYSAIAENQANYQNTLADFTFYRKVLKTEDKGNVKVGELNYLHDIKRVLQVPPYTANETPHMYENTTKSLSDNQDFFYSINNTDLLIPLTGNIQPAQVKSADEEIVKWVYTDESKTDSLFTAVEKGKTKITVKVKVIVVSDDPNTEDNEEKSYTMKRKFQLQVLPRAKEPEGKNMGEYVLVKSADELEDGTRLLIIGTRTKDSESTNYALGANNSMMGGGKGGTKVDNDKITTNGDNRECIKYEDVPEGVQEIILEKAEDGTSWYLNVGKDENGDKLYLYASVKEKTSETEDPEGSGNGSGFNMDEMMEMFNPSSGLKVGTKAGTASKEEGVDSLKATISISDDIATIKFPAIADANDKNTIVLTSSFDMDALMNMFGENNNEEETEGNNNEEETEGMNFDFFMASFNTKKPADIDGNKAMMPRIFGFVQCDEYPVNIGLAEWMTIVSDFDVTPDDGVEAYVVTKVTQSEEQSKATLKAVEQLKGGEPYLLHSTSGTYTMTRSATEVDKPAVNLLLVSDETTSGDNGSVYVLANKNEKVGFYKWTGGLLGSGRVYLPVGSSTTTREFVSFDSSEASGIVNIEHETTTDSQYYMLDGRHVKTLTKGLYIVNGKKVVIK